MHLVSKGANSLREYFINHLGRDCEPIFDNLFNALIETRSCIAGGSLLSYINDEPLNDIDVYVPTNQYIRFLKKMTENLEPSHKIDVLTTVDKNLVPKYDGSFFKKNKIRIKYTFTIKSVNRKTINVDVMLIDTDFIEVVTNFDLTFCEVFFDGKKLYTTSAENLKDIRSKKGILKPDYHESYYDQNAFIHGRLLKYQNRGYDISIEGNRKTIIKPCKYKNRKKTIEHEEEYIVKLLIELLFFYSIFYYNTVDMFGFFKNILDHHEIPLVTDLKSRGTDAGDLRITEIVFFAEMKELTLKELLAKIMFYGSGSLYLYLFTLLEHQMNIIRSNQLKRYNNWYYHTFLPNMMYKAISEHHAESERRGLMRELIRIFKGIEPGVGMTEVYAMFEAYKITPKHYKEAHRLTYEELYKMYPNQCKLINPTAMYDSEKHKKQLECYTSSSEHTVLEIIQKYLYIPFAFMVQHDFYYNRRKLIAIKHDLSLPPDMIGEVVYDPNAPTYDLVEGEELLVKDALGSNQFVFKHQDNYFHYDERSLSKSLSNKDSWMYECLIVDGARDNNEELFVKLNGNGTFLIPCNYLFAMFQSTNRLFEIVESDRTLEKTVSFKNTKYGAAMGIQDYVSANHCQDGSDFKVYKLVNEEPNKENKELKPLFHNSHTRSNNTVLGGFRKSIKRVKKQSKRVKLPKRISKRGRKLSKRHK